MFKEIILFAAIFAVCIGEAPLSGPYPPSGWKPQGAPFTLPKDFLPQQQQQQQQQQQRQQQQQQNGNVEVQITRERVQFAGHFDDTTTTAYPDNAYLPPGQTDDIPEEDNTTEDFLKVQGLPQNELNQLEFAPPQARAQYRFQNNRQFGQIRQFQPQQFGRQSVPAPQYGPPQQDNENAEPNPPSTTEDSEEDTTSEVPNDAEVEDNDEPTIAVSNSVSNGQYYVLTPDNTLQRVVFMTTQNEDEARTNGFTAQLRYMPVEPIRDPIYSYNQEGQLIRIYNKK